MTSDGILRVRNRGEVVAEIPNGPLVDEAPVYNRPVARPAYLDSVARLDESALASVKMSPVDALRTILGSPTVASKRWVYRQYDHMVRTNSIVLAGMGAGVVRIKGTNRALAMSTDGNGRYCYLNPRRGAMLALAEAARNVACAGALPIGGTNCLNFGNPERPEIMWQFVEAVEGLADACRALDIPITGGNVSLYNETDGQAIYPTPIIGVVGLIENATRVVSRTFKQAGDEVVLLGEGYGELGGSEYLKAIYGLVQGQPPELNLDKERSLIALLTRAASSGLLQSAHDCSDGGVAVTLAECAFDTGGIGCAVDLPLSTNAAATLFGESASRAVVSMTGANAQKLLELAAGLGVPARSIGRTGGASITMTIGGSPAIACSLAEAEQIWSQALGRYFAGRAA